MALKIRTLSLKKNLDVLIKKKRVFSIGSFWIDLYDGGLSSVSASKWRKLCANSTPVASWNIALFSLILNFVFQTCTIIYIARSQSHTIVTYLFLIFLQSHYTVLYVFLYEVLIVIFLSSVTANPITIFLMIYPWSLLRSEYVQ